MEIFIDPFLETPALKRAFAAALAISVAGAPLGVLLNLRRMSLAADVYTHTVLPGVAVAFLLAGGSMWAMIAGGLISGLIAAYLSGVIARMTILKEDATLAAFYMISLALSVILLVDNGDGEALLEVLFGSAFEIDKVTLLVITTISSATLFALAIAYRALIAESYDPGFLSSVGGSGAAAHMLFITLVILNLVIGATALGAIMAVGLMTIPGATARFWSKNLGATMLIAILIAAVSSVTGLLVAYHQGLPPGPTVILSAGLVYVGSIIFGREGGLITRFGRVPHLES